MPATYPNQNDAQSKPDTTSESVFSSLQCASADCVRDNPLTSTMLAMGAGAAIGLLIATSLGRREEQKRSSYMSQLANQIANSVGNIMPDYSNWKR